MSKRERAYKKCVCGKITYGGVYCGDCLMKMRLWREVLALVLGCKRSEVEQKQKDYLAKKEKQK